MRGAGTINVTNGATFVTDNGYFTNFTSIRNFNGANIVMKNGANAYSLNFLPANTTINSLTLGITNGTPSFDSSITINNYIKFQSGTGIYSLNNTLTLGPNFTFIGSDSTYKLLRCTGTGEIRKQFNSPGSFKFEISRGDIYIPVVVNFTGGTFNPGAYVGIKPVYDGSAHPNNTSTTNYLKRYWTLSSSGINNFTANLTFKYRTADVIGPENTLYTSCYSNGKWTQYNKADTTNKYLTAFVGSFGDFTGAGQNMNQLPQTFIRNNLNMNFGANSNIKDTIIYPSSPGMSAQTNFISNVQVKIDTALCTRTGDLDFELIHQGVTDTIIYKVGGSGANFIGTTLNDSTATLLTSGSAPFNGKYKPYKPLSQFNNQSPEGSWILRLNNSGSSSSGILKSWSLRIIYYSSPYSFINITAIPSGFYDAGTGMLTMKDTVKAYIALNTPPYTIIDSAKAVIDSVTFTGQFKFNTAPTGTYYIILKHRNSIDTWSTAGGISFSRGNIMNFDFTTSQAQAFGNNLVQVGTKWCLINGDCNGDGYIDGSDYLEVINHYDESGYLKGDTNGDGYVDGSDYLAIINNYDKGVVMPASPMRKISIRKIR